MDFEIDMLVYVIIGVIFVLVQVTRKRIIAFGKPQADPAANRVDEPVRIDQIPPYFTEPVDFQRITTATGKAVHPKSSFNDPGVRAGAGRIEPARLPDGNPQFSLFEPLSELVYSVILERKYV